MLNLKDIQFDPKIEDPSSIKNQRTQGRSLESLLVVDWTKSSLTPQQIVQTCLPLVQFAHEQGYPVHVKIPLVLMTRFSYDGEPIVFCGHTLNPFVFEQVDVILDSTLKK